MDTRNRFPSELNDFANSLIWIASMYDTHETEKIVFQTRKLFTYLTVKSFMHNQVCGKYVCNQLVTEKTTKTEKASRHKLLFTERIIEEYRVVIVLSNINQYDLLYEFCIKTDFKVFE